jgi:hypothetical protein
MTLHKFSPDDIAGIVNGHMTIAGLPISDLLQNKSMFPSGFEFGVTSQMHGDRIMCSVHIQTSNKAYDIAEAVFIHPLDSRERAERIVLDMCVAVANSILQRAVGLADPSTPKAKE